MSKQETGRTVTHGTGNFEVKSWDESQYNEVDGLPKLTKANVTNMHHGVIEGEGTSSSLMVYAADGSASFVSLERVIGKIGDRSGSFVLQGSGTYSSAEGIARGNWFVVPGSGTGDLGGLRGEGGFVASHEPRGTITFDYYFE
jgi:hypothetical protein